MAIIATIDQLRDTITDIMTPVSMPDGKMSNIMDSTETNLFFESLEDVLNALYVKCRELEDLHDFAQAYVQREFGKCKTASDQAVNAVNQKADDYAATTRQLSTCSFTGASVVRDRDGIPIPMAAQEDGNRLVPYSVTLQAVQQSLIGRWHLRPDPIILFIYWNPWLCKELWKQ